MERSEVWKGTLVYVFCLSGYRCLSDGGTDRCEILHDSTYMSVWGSFSLLEAVTKGIPKIQNFQPKFWLFDREYI